MDTSLNTIRNNALAALGGGASGNVMNSIKNASARTGVDFAYLVKQANTESAFNPAAKAKTSSASGLYQFVEGTWLSMVKKYGDKYGMGDLADKIDAKGHVTDKAAKQQILALRNDPEKSSAMAAELASDNKEFLQANWGGKVGSTELYLAHFMGAGGAASFLKAHDDNPLQQAAVLFPAAAKANRNVFYDTATGRPKTLGEVYAFFDKKFDAKTSLPPAAASAAPQVADAGDSANDLMPQTKTASRGFSGNYSVRTAHANTGGASGNFFSPAMYGQLMANPADLLMLSQLQLPGNKKGSIFN